MNGHRNYCDRISRRNALRVGLGSSLAGSIGLPQLLAADAAAQHGVDTSRDDVSLIILFLQGGLSTIDTLDLKPNAPAEFRGEFKPIDTVVPGMQVCEHTPGLAKVADRFSLLRNFTHHDSGHGPADHYMLTGYAPRAGFNGGLKPNNHYPAHGSIIAKTLGPRGSVPPYVCLPKMHNSGGSAYLGSNYAPFVVDADPNAPDFSVPDLVPPLTVDSTRLDSRRQLMKSVDRFQKSGEAAVNSGALALTTFQKKAFDLVTSPATKIAFDIEAESTAVRDEYGRHSLGQSCLMARRLVEAGVRCVTIDHTNWDTHYNNFTVLKDDLLPHLDSGLPMLLRDLEQRGMLDTTLVCVMGEFGRTPRVNQYAGRDHWGPSNCILLAGGGIKPGRVIGATNSKGERPAADPVGPEDLSATMYSLLGIDGKDEFYTPEGRPVKIVNDGRVLTELL
ncbi:MAG: DUF1501 domain-containing protein [Planctomycetota bacterium]|mgnify:FL=1|nr:DUF1501 domain-containing protein [Planctomycetota bacterium]MDA1248638.1 DUF1501 domain-containing protein [Planctomycetota bacterium]